MDAYTKIHIQIFNMVYNLLRSILTNYYEYYHHTNTPKSLDLVRSLITASDDKIDMTEIRQNTDNLFNQKNMTDYEKRDYTNISKYMSGSCWMNSKLSAGIDVPLSEDEKQIMESINRTVNKVTPLSYPVVLLHGFEIGTIYNDDQWRSKHIIKIPGFVSKTPSFKVATRFANGYVNYSNNKYRSSYIVVSYPEGSQHINLDIRNKKNEEYKYLTRSNESLIITDIVKIFAFPHLYVFYLCAPIFS